MNGPRSERSARLRLTATALFVACVLANVIFNVRGHTDWVRWAVGVPMTFVWLGTLVAYRVSRLHDVRS